MLLFLVDNIVKSGIAQFNINTASTICGGILDIFVAYMVFFVFDVNSETPDLVQDKRAEKEYQIMDVIQTNQTEECDSDEQSD